MANFKIVNKTIKNTFPSLDIEVVRGYGYVYFNGKDGIGIVDSIMAHPVSTSTDDLIRLCIDEVECSLNANS